MKTIRALVISTAAALLAAACGRPVYYHPQPADPPPPEPAPLSCFLISPHFGGEPPEWVGTGGTRTDEETCFVGKVDGDPGSDTAVLYDLARLDAIKGATEYLRQRAHAASKRMRSAAIEGSQKRTVDAARSVDYGARYQGEARVDQLNHGRVLDELNYLSETRSQAVITGFKQSDTWENGNCTVFIEYCTSRESLAHSMALTTTESDIADEVRRRLLRELD